MKRLLIIIGKIIVKLLKLLHRNAGNLPGIVLWHLSRHKAVSMFKVDCPIIAITGTNGKTSVTNCIAQLFERSGKKIIINKEGNNLDTGICSMLLKYCDMSGKVKADYLILETDESHVPVVYSQLKLDTLVVLNFFRDQLDRNGEMETLIQKINGFCKTFEGNLILNGDDPNTARLGRANPKNKNVKYFHAEPYAFATKKIFEASEGRFCPFCGEPLEYEYYQYSHIGKFICKKCSFGDYEPYITAKDIDLEKPVFTADGHTYSPKLNSIYNVYNMTAVAAAAKLYNIEQKITDGVINSYTVKNGRMENFMLGKSKATLNLAKNPVGANMTLRVMNEMQGEKELLFVLNDNIADGLDVSWIYDINFSIFERVTRVVTSGTRAYDIAVRIKTAGYDPAKIVVRPDLDKAVEELASTESRKFIIANYTAVQPTRAALKRYIAKHGGNK
ncbi:MULTISPECIES: Mur ligase family protein [Ruminococcus]|uniref:Lipid II isoglutaminyl synthase (glutamine-hydrolyzing) subunit MurT n=1 Tax=Ruminococcus flavefaciens TaxID=1265 RepID=A0A1M7KKZ1_RUMFL|nr:MULTISPECIES: Mur ligase family protein [Ruminococcus]MCR4794809.1 MurT ligase domain-containing protein [Ruminococcus sp.]SHM66092.1 UDP-N-acetylmuramyl tripeptide synthase [Ruminococcus flavefaciens]